MEKLPMAREDRKTHLWRNASLATMRPMADGLGLVEKAAILEKEGRIAYIGAEKNLPAGLHNVHEIDCEGRWITPGLIDCHTHLVHAGNRAQEFEKRLAGASYEEIAAAGGDILSSVQALRKASKAELLAQSLPRLDALIAEGVTTIEIKSGYGLDLENEAKTLQVARQLGEERSISVRTSFLGAHALPPEAAGDRDKYIDLVASEMLPAIAQLHLADSVDGFCENIAFSPAQIERLFEVAKALGLPVRLHADQLSDSGGAALAARFGALSADHLEYADEAGIAEMANSRTVAVLLPGAFYFLREKRRPPIELFRKHHVPMALASDCNPGTSPLTSLLLTMNMGATLYQMSVEECLLGVTRHAAKALGIHGQTGTLEIGKRADLAIWNIGSPAELVYRMGFNPLHQRVWRGTWEHGD